MKKKSINLLLIALIIAVVALAGVVLLISLNKKKANNESGEQIFETNNVELINVLSKDELGNYVKENELKFQINDDVYKSLDGITVGGYKMSIYYSLNQDGKVMQVNGKFDFKPKGEKEVVALQHELVEIRTLFGKAIKGNLDHYSIYASDGYPLEVTEDESYQAILKGEAVFSLTVRDADGTFWEIRGEKADEGKVQIEWFHSLDVETYKDLTVDVTLQQE